ncbi:MAG: CARDB domain-containing protein [Polyangiales bacterium]
MLCFRTRSLLFAALLLTACGQDPLTDEMGEQTVAVIEGSPEAGVVLAFVNDLNVTEAILDDEVGLDRRAAANIIEHRDGLPGPDDDDLFDDIEELDSVAYVGESAIAKILAYAVAGAEEPASVDLIVDNASLALDRAEEGEVVAANCDVRNAGSEGAGESRLKYYFSRDRVLDDEDTYLNYDDVDALEGGASEQEQANLRVPAGTTDGYYYILFVADFDGDVTELDEDNANAVPLMVGGVDALPDLVATDVVVPSPVVLAGETLEVSATVANLGFAAAEASRLIYLLSTDERRDAGDRQLSFDSVGALSPGARSQEGAQLRVSTATSAGAYYLLLVVDADEDTNEFDEANNTVAVPFLVTRDAPDADRADLIIEGATLEGRDGTFAASLQVANRGVRAAESNILRYYLSNDDVLDVDDAYLNYDRVGELGVDELGSESANLSLGNVVDEGGWFVLVVVDANDDVSERFESNNLVAMPVVASDPAAPRDNPDLEAPDLMVVDGVTESMEVPAGTRAALHVQLENVGDFPAASSRVKYYLSHDRRYDESDDYVGADSVPALMPGQVCDESVEPLIPAIAEHGTWYLLAVADAGETVVETFESNNVRATPIEVTVDDPSLDAADLFSASASIDRTSIEAGRKAYVNFTVENGGVRSAEPVRIKFYLSSDTRRDDDDDYLAYRDTSALAVGSHQDMNADLRIPADAEDGSAYILIVMDSERAIEERYESNNVLAIPFNIGADSADAPVYPYQCPLDLFADGDLLPLHTIATFNTLHLGHDNGKDLASLACIVSHFDLVGLQEIETPQAVAELVDALEFITGEAWFGHVSPREAGRGSSTEFYAFVWRTADVQMTEAIGFYPDLEDDFKREPYGANFRMGQFDFTFLTFHQRYGELAQRREEARHLGDVYAYFQEANGSESDVLIGGDFNLPADDAAYLFLGGGDDITFVTAPEQKTSIGLSGLSNSFDNIFFPGPYLSEMTGSGALDFTNANWMEMIETVTDHIPVWASFDIRSDDD